MGSRQSAPEGDYRSESVFSDEPLLSFFVVGDIGEPGYARRNVARAMAARRAEGRPKKFVLATGDNFYECKGQEQFGEAFKQLREDMLDVVQLPWYFVLGNHDVEKGGARMHTEEWHGMIGRDASGVASWEFRCPGTHYSLNDDWSDRDDDWSDRATSLDSDLIDIVVINTNKRKELLNFVGLREGSLKEESVSWGGQKLWLQERLSSSKATWKIVVGHHPIEFVPQNFLEHGLPGVRFLTTKFMKGHTTSKLRKTGLRDVIVQGRADLYLCGHQHLMAHMVRKRSPRHGPETLDYVVIGSSSKLEQDAEDYEGAADEAANNRSQVDAGTSAGSMRSELESESEEETSQQAPVPASWWMPSIKNKMAKFWHAEEIGFTVVDVARTQLRIQFYSVQGPRVTKIHECVKTTSPDA